MNFPLRQQTMLATAWLATCAVLQVAIAATWPLSFVRAISTNDANALAELYAATSGEWWLSSCRSGWTGNAPSCTSTGVVCDTNGNVVSIVLPQCNLSGVLPSSTALDLASLTELDLSDNNLVGRGPALFASSSLQTVRLHHNQFHGSLPYFATTQLLEVNVSHNRFSGTLPPWTQLTQTNPTLRRVSVSSNRLTGTIPDIWDAAAAALQMTLEVDNNCLNTASCASCASWAQQGLQFADMGMCRSSSLSASFSNPASASVFSGSSTNALSESRSATERLSASKSPMRTQSHGSLSTTGTHFGSMTPSRSMSSSFSRAASYSVTRTKPSTTVSFSSVPSSTKTVSWTLTNSSTENATVSLAVTPSQTVSCCSPTESMSRSVPSPSWSATAVSTQSASKTKASAARSASGTFTSTGEKTHDDAAPESVQLAAITLTIVAYGSILVSAASAGVAASTSTSSVSLVLLMQVSSCASRDTTTTTDDLLLAASRAGGYSKYAVAPLWGHGFLIAMYGNVAILFGVAWLHAMLARYLGNKGETEHLVRQWKLSFGAKTMDEVEIEDAEERERTQHGILRTMPSAAMRAWGVVRFPSLSIQTARALIPGAAFSAVAFLVLITADNTGGYPAVVILIMATLSCLCWFAYVHFRLQDCLAYEPLVPPDLDVRGLIGTDRGSWPMWSLSLITYLLPTHRWTQQNFAEHGQAPITRAFGELFVSMRPPFTRHPSVEFAFSVWIGMFSGLAAFGSGLSCVIGTGVMGISFLLWAAYTAYYRCHHAPLSRIWIPFANVAMGCLSAWKSLSTDLPGQVMAALALLNAATTLVAILIRREERRVLEFAVAAEVHIRALEIRSRRLQLGDHGSSLATIVDSGSEATDDLLEPPPPPLAAVNREASTAF